MREAIFVSGRGDKDDLNTLRVLDVGARDLWVAFDGVRGPQEAETQAAHVAAIRAEFPQAQIYICDGRLGAGAARRVHLERLFGVDGYDTVYEPTGGVPKIVLAGMEAHGYGDALVEHADAIIERRVPFNQLEERLRGFDVLVCAGVPMPPELIGEARRLGLQVVTVMSKAADHQRLLRPGLRTFVTSEQLVPMTSQGALMRACDIIPRVRREHSGLAGAGDLVPVARPLHLAAGNLRILADAPPLLYISQHRCRSGYGEAARLQLCALVSAGQRVRAQAAGAKMDLPGPLAEFARSLEGGAGAAPKAVVLHLTAKAFKPFLQLKDMTPVIGLAVWETTRIPDEWVHNLNQCTRLWVPSEYQKAAYERSGVVRPIDVVPFAIPPHVFPHEDLTGGLKARQRPGGVLGNELGSIGDNTRVFLSIFQWQHRKNPEGLLAAYYHAFTGADDVVLVIKSYLEPNASGNDKLAKVLREALERIKHPNPPRIVLLHRFMNSVELRALYGFADAYVSLSRAEGWGLPMHEAQLAGLPCIQTDFSANAETFGAGALRVPAHASPVYGFKHGEGQAWRNFYDCRGTWWEPALVQAADIMRRVYEDPDFRLSAARAGQASALEFTIERQAEAVKASLASLDL
jgi:glycosyltransferase involved in cell wall biosynthesis